MTLYGIFALLNVFLYWLLISEQALGWGFVGAPIAISVTTILQSLALLWLTPRLVVRLFSSDPLL